MIVNEGNETEFERLVRSGVNINQKNENGSSAIILAAEKGEKWFLPWNGDFISYGPAFDCYINNVNIVRPEQSST